MSRTVKAARSGATNPRGRNGRGSHHAKHATWRLTPRAQLESHGEAPNGFLLDTYSASICECNATAWALLRLLRRGASTARLTQELVRRHGAKARDAHLDAVNFVRRLRRLGLADVRE